MQGNVEPRNSRPSLDGRAAPAAKDAVRKSSTRRGTQLPALRARRTPSRSGMAGRRMAVDDPGLDAQPLRCLRRVPVVDRPTGRPAHRRRHGPACPAGHRRSRPSSSTVAPTCSPRCRDRWPAPSCTSAPTACHRPFPADADRSAARRQSSRPPCSPNPFRSRPSIVDSQRRRRLPRGRRCDARSTRSAAVSRATRRSRPARSTTTCIGSPITLLTLPSTLDTNAAAGALHA